jgi:hypothetical protein
VLSRIFGLKGDKMKGQSRKLHNEELRDLYSLPSIIRIIKSRRMKWSGHVAQMGNGYLWERARQQDQDVSGWIILAWILEKWDGVMWTGLVWLMIRTGGGFL